MISICRSAFSFASNLIMTPLLCIAHASYVLVISNYNISCVILQVESGGSDVLDLTPCLCLGRRRRQEVSRTVYL